MPAIFDASRYLDELNDVDLIRTNGKVSQVIGTVVESNGPPMAIGETASITYRRTAQPVLAEAVGFRDAKVLLMPLGELGGIAAGSTVVARQAAASGPVRRAPRPRARRFGAPDR